MATKAGLTGREIGQEEVTTQNVLKKFKAEKAGLNAWEEWQEYHKGTAQAERDAKEKTANEVLSDEELSQVPEGIRRQVSDIYNKYMIEIFKLEKMKVTPKDPEWLTIQAEIEDATSTLTRALIAAREAAQRKKQRLQGMSDIEIRDNMYKKE